MASRTDEVKAMITNGKGWGLSVPAVTLPAVAGSLPAALQDLARAFIAARERSGTAYLEAAAALAEARATARHGEWHTFLETIELNQDKAERMLNVHDRAIADASFALAVRNDFLSRSTAALLAQPSTPPEVIEAVLIQDTPPTARQIRAAISQAKQDITIEPLDTSASGIVTQPGQIWHAVRINGTPYEWSLIYDGDRPITDGEFIVYGFKDPRSANLIYIGKTQQLHARMNMHAIGQGSPDLIAAFRAAAPDPIRVCILAIAQSATELDDREYALINEHRSTLLNMKQQKWEVKAPKKLPATLRNITPTPTDIADRARSLGLTLGTLPNGDITIDDGRNVHRAPDADGAAIILDGLSSGVAARVKAARVRVEAMEGTMDPMPDARGNYLIVPPPFAPETMIRCTLSELEPYLARWERMAGAKTTMAPILIAEVPIIDDTTEGVAALALGCQLLGIDANAFLEAVEPLLSGDTWDALAEVLQ